MSIFAIKFTVMENILITGGNGQLGNELKNIASNYPDYTFYFTDVDELDICDEDAVEDFVNGHNISKIINCAAYNNVDKAEDDNDTAFKINVMGPANLAQTAAEKDLYLIHFSTDFVFNGEKTTPYHECDRPAPLSQYGKTKYAGEIAIKKSGCRSIIIRTAWLYSIYGKNFVKTMIKLGYENDELKVVYDQVGCPTSAEDLAAAVMHIIPQLDARPRYGEVFHFTDEGHCSRAEFAAKIMEKYRLECDILPISSEEYGSVAKRPKYSVLEKSLIRNTFGVKVPRWEMSLGKVLRTLEKMEEKQA